MRIRTISKNVKIYHDDTEAMPAERSFCIFSHSGSLMPIYLTAAAVGVTICGIGVEGCLNGAWTQANMQGRD